MDLRRYAALFLADSREHLRRCTAELLKWEERPESLTPVDELFRAFHSIKGSAATMEYTAVADLSHAVENLLDGVRQRRLAPSKAVIGLLFQSVDLLDRGLEPAIRGEPLGEVRLLTDAISRLTASATPSLLEAPPETPRPVAGAAASQRQVGRARVDPIRLDELLQQAGELVVARNRLTEVAAIRADPELEAVVGRIDTLTRSLHAGVLRVRLAPLNELFGRFPRIVRDLSQSLGKVAKLEVRGEGIELDRTLLEELFDPLIHLVRNAVDHGIERPEDRLARGKSAEGRLVLGAERRRDVVVIRLVDDGAGIDRDAVVAKAVAAGLVQRGAELASEDLLAIVARPGFTTKESVTAVSGRGVGMDAVLTKVRSLGGRVVLRSEVGRGTEFEIVMPLTTAVQRVLLVSANQERYALPFRLVQEATVTGHGGDGTVGGGEFSFRGRTMPFRDLGASVGGLASGQIRRPVLMLEWGAGDGALGVDGLLGQYDVLLERIEAPASLPAWVSGATILGDGSPAFVLDPTALF